MAINIVVPQLGESVVEARVARWLKREGEAVAAGEPVVELETEKIDLEVGAEQAGVLVSIKHPEGADVKVGDVLAVVEAGASAAAPAAEGGAAATPAPAAPAPAAKDAKDAKDGQKATPTARKMAEAHDVALSAVAGSGDAGRITKKDVAGQIQAPSPAAVPASAPAGRCSRSPAAPGRQSRQAGGACRRSGAAARAGHPRRDPRADVEAPPDDRPQSGRGAAHRGHADHLQRGGHDRADGPARAPQAGVQGTLRPRARHRLVLRQGLGGGAARVPPSQRRDPGRGDGAQALLRHRRSPSARRRGSSSR